MAKIDWTVTGCLNVEDFLTPNISLDADPPNGTAVIDRALAGVKINVKASLYDNGPYESWGTDVTSDTGHFRIDARKSDKPRKFLILVQLNDKTLSVQNKTLIEWLAVYQSSEKEAAPRLDLGVHVLRAGSGGTVVLETQYKALTWYICKSVIDLLAGQGSASAFKRKFRVHVPTATLSGISWARGVGNDAVYVVTSAFNLVTIIHEIMHLWNYQHNTGMSNWLGAVWGDSDTAGDQENPNIAFHEGFAEYAAWELMHLLWAAPKALPYPRDWYVSKGYTSLDRVERNWHGVKSCLRMLTAVDPAGLDVGVAGDGASGYAASSGVPAGCPAGQLVSFFDLLRVFSPGGGWTKQWEVGNKSYGVRRFFRRASDILDSFSDEACQLMLDVLDPSATVQMVDRCTELAPDSDPNARILRNRTRPTIPRTSRTTRTRPSAKVVLAKWRHRKPR